MLDAVTDPCKQGIQALLALELAGIDPEKLFQSLKAEYPTTASEEEFRPDQPIFMYDTTGTYVPATMIGKVPNQYLWDVRLGDASVITISRHFIRSKLPEGKRACLTQKQLNAFALYDSASFTALDPTQQGLVLAGLAKAFLKQ